MSWFHIDLVRGERAMFVSPRQELEASSYASPGGIIAQLEGANRVSLYYFMGRPVYEAENAGGQALFDARTGEKISPLNAEQAEDVATRDYIGKGSVAEIQLMNDPPHEYRGKRPVWRISFSDRLHTRLYISPENGKVEARRNDIWRLYDFFWMLHIMDYGERENFNNPLVKAASALGLFFSVTGLVLLFTRNGRRTILADLNTVAKKLKISIRR